MIRGVLQRLAAMRGYMRKRQVTGEVDEALPASVGLTPDDLETMYRLLAIAKYDDRYVIPKAHRELGAQLMEQQGACGLDFDGGPGNCGAVGNPAAQRQRALHAQEEPAHPRPGTGMRSRRSGPRPYKLLSVLLRYPDERLVGAHDEIAAAIAALQRPEERKPLALFAEHLAGETQLSLARAYVETFDLHRRTSLYLTYYQHGDTRKRGMALLRLKRLYAAGGLEQAERRALRLPAAHARVRRARTARPRRDAAARAPAGARAAPPRPPGRGEPYAHLLEALCAGLPRLSPVEREHVRRLPPTALRTSRSASSRSRHPRPCREMRA